MGSVDLAAVQAYGARLSMKNDNKENLNSPDGGDY